MFSNFTEEEAKKRTCPIRCHEKDSFVKCLASGCMSWTVAFHRVVREDHSGGGLRTAELGSTTGRRARREGPPGCLGVWILDGVGYCKLIKKKNDSE